jgi:hypothetical protein
VYRDLEILENPKFDDEGNLLSKNAWHPGDELVESEKRFPGRAGEIDADKVYTWTEVVRFEAGSYSGYGHWRNLLKDFKGAVAFQELINFSDAEGVIDYKNAEKLANDFALHEDEARVFSETLGIYGKYWFHLYLEWKKGFQVASENGAIRFT